MSRFLNLENNHGPILYDDITKTQEKMDITFDSQQPASLNASMNYNTPFLSEPSSHNKFDEEASYFQQQKIQLQAQNIKPFGAHFSPLNNQDSNLPSKYILDKLRKHSSNMEVETINNTKQLYSRQSIDKTSKNLFSQKQQTPQVQAHHIPSVSSFNSNSKSITDTNSCSSNSIQAQRHGSIIKRWKNKDSLFEGNFHSGATPNIKKRDLVEQLVSKSKLESVESRIKNLGNADNINASLNNSYILKAKILGSCFNAQPFGTESSDKRPRFMKNLFENELEEEVKTELSESASIFKEQKKFCELEKNFGLAHNNGLINKNLFGDFNNAKEGMNLEANDIPQSPKLLQNKILDKLGTPTIKKSNLFDEKMNEFPTIHKNESRSNVYSMLQIASPKKDYFQFMQSNENNSIGDTSFVLAKSNLSYEKNLRHAPNSMEIDSSSYSRFTNDFTIHEVLGSGYFGTVYTCQNKLDGLTYAIKSTHGKLNGQNMTQALNEAQALASLCALDENPFIVRYYNAWIEDNKLYLVMEHCHGNLKSLKEDPNRFCESGIRRILRDICQGLRHLHKQKIVHLDIKPDLNFLVLIENLLYSKTDKYKIADLGLSRISMRQIGEDINEGDSRYLAPELLNDAVDVDQIPDLTKADIFSLGVSMYELIIGEELPKNGPEWHALRSNYQPKLQQLKSYSETLKNLIKAMMNSNPDERPSANDILSNYLLSEMELELKWEKKKNRILRDRIKEYEEKLTIKRKASP